MRIYFYLLLLSMAFASGAIIWRIKSSPWVGLKDLSFASMDSESSLDTVLLSVGGHEITYRELDLQYRLYEAGFSFKEADYPQELKTAVKRSDLMGSLLEALIEARIVHLFLRKQIDLQAFFNKTKESFEESFPKELESIRFEFTEKDRAILKNHLFEKKLIQAFINEYLSQKATPTDADCLDYYRAHQSEFMRDRQFVIRQIVTATENAAKEAMVGLRRNNFAEKAKELSITPEAVNGGRLGPFSRDEIPQLSEIVAKMNVGSIHGIHKTTYGFHVILLEQTLPKKQLAFDEVKSRIKENLRQTRVREEYSLWLKNASNSIDVRVIRPSI